MLPLLHPRAPDRCAARRRNPQVKWAQRMDRLFVTICVADIKDESVELTADKIVFKGKSVRHDSPPTTDLPCQQRAVFQPGVASASAFFATWLTNFSVSARREVTAKP